MSLLMTKDKKEIVVTCTCGCHNSFHIEINDEDKDSGYYAYMCFLKGNEYTEGERSSPWRALMLKLKKLWCVLRGKDYCYSDTLMSREDFEEFKRYVNQFE